jgi:glycosyltransferase involved in cell wall biosynthesis
MRATLRRVDSLILLSDHLRSDFDFEPALGSKIRIVPNGVPGPIDPSGKRLPTGAEPIRIVYLSTLYSSKGYLDLLRAVAILRRRNKLNIHCAFCGALYEGAERRPSTFAGSGFANSISRMGLESAVTYEGLVLGEEKAEMLRRSHIFVLPTAYPNEGQPISAIEALSYGIPVVATPYRGLKDIVVDGLTGLFVPFGDPCSLAKSLSRLVSDARLYERMSEGALARYQEQFTLSQHLKGVMAAFE